MLILQRYLLFHALAASLLSLVVFLGVVSALFLAELLGDAAQGELPGQSVFLLLVFRLPEAVMMVGPLALLTGVLLTLGRMHEDSEITILRAGGMSFARVLAPVAVLSVFWAVIMLLVSGWLAPHAVDRTVALMQDAARHAAVAGIRPGQFDPVNQGQVTAYVGELERSRGELADIFLQHEQSDRAEVLTADRGRIWVNEEDDSRYLSLEDGNQVLYRRPLADAPVRRMRFARNDVRLPAPEVSGGQEEARASLFELLGAHTPAQRQEWHWRLAAPVAAVLLGLLALPLSHRLPRQGRFGSVVAALLLYLVYSNGIHLGLIGMEQRDALQGPGLWPVHGVLAGVVAVLAWRQRRLW